MHLHDRIRSVSGKVYWKEIVAVVMLLMAIVFFKSERKDLGAILPHIQQANPLWLFAALCLTVLSLFLQGGIYKKTFAAVALELRWMPAVFLFLKRNLISVFLPAGGVSSLAYSPVEIRRSGYNTLKVHQASVLFALTGVLTVFMAGLPVMCYMLITKNQFGNSWVGLLIVGLLLATIFVFIRSFQKRNVLYRKIEKKFPALVTAIQSIVTTDVNGRQFLFGVLYSIGIELVTMLHVYVMMKALGLPASFAASAAAYIISVLLMILSPFLRGLGAVELSMAYVLQRFGYPAGAALSITILYRVFEFWMPLAFGLLAFAWRGRQIFFRIAPALLVFLLGMVNIISAVTAPIHDRFRLLREYLPLTAIHASNLLVLFTGLSLLVTSGFLFRGLRNAWAIAIGLSLASLIGHVTKALDYEEAAFAAVTCIVLLSTAGQYRLRSSSIWMKTGLKTALASLVAVLLFGYISFYFIDVKHFGIDFSWQQSIEHTIKIFLLIEDESLHPLTRFAHEFVALIRALGFLTWGFLLFTIIKPQLIKRTANETGKERIKLLLSQYGHGSIDYYKTYKDKLYFLSDQYEAFIAYRIARGFAIVLEEPVCRQENKISVLNEFDIHCKKMGLKTAYYRVDESSLPWFSQLRKKKLMIGQEAVIELKQFSLEGKDKKSLRNGLNSLQKNGYTVSFDTAPHSPGFLEQLRLVSDDWLSRFAGHEQVFSQGLFDAEELSQHDIITLRDAEGIPKAFLNIIPDYAYAECTYDLIRKTSDAPSAAMDALITRLIEYAKERNYLYLNLGLVPMTGISLPDNTAEKFIKVAAERIKGFQHYKGLRAFKEKYATHWQNKYLVYENHFDLLQLPIALKYVMKP